MADSRRPVNEELRPVEDPPASELEREERRLERLRLIANRWPAAQPLDELEPDPNEAA